MYPLGIVGNCQISALIHESGSLEWLCLPRPDSEPIFGRLLDPSGGHFSISLCDGGVISSEQSYLENTNILITEIEGSRGGKIRITDFCPRFEQYGRMFRPLMMIRMVEPLEPGTIVQIDCRPIKGWGKEPMNPIRGNSHLRFDWNDDSLRLTTNMPLTYLGDSTPFQLKEKLYFALTWGTGVEEDLVSVSERFFLQTRDYWRTWVKHCSIPVHFQKEVIRSALALKLHCYEDTGAILAATTTSLPEELNGTRNWDYRFCWLRDAYFTLSAFHSLGHFEEMEGFLKFLLDIAFEHAASRERLSPLYTISRGIPLAEQIHSNWQGYQKSQPVRSNNQASEHIQNDVYGEMILTLAPIYFDERFQYLRDGQHQRLLEYLATHASRAIGQKDAGLWEFRNTMREHSFTNLMLWAGFERLDRIQKNGFLPQFKIDSAVECKRAELSLRSAVKDGILRSTSEGSNLDSALSHLSLLRFPDRILAEKTLEQIRSKLLLSHDSKTFFYRYLQEDDFGIPRSAFIACSFWIAQALAQQGEVEDARLMIERTLESSNFLGLFSEHFDPATKQQLGNFPQTYSHVGLINAAFAVSPRWSDVL
ncbi:MAG: glycoside hydrolase family 15 protein [Deltaproteobacteria bacterium]|nr:glycoside hydrolase family 15 protein [Deltaproteobacteria bacterium]